MGTIIAVANQKGGVGKTTTAVNLSAALGEMGKKTLLVDADPQGNSSSGVGIDRKHSRKTVYELLIGECGVEEILVHTDYQNLDILPSSMNLAAAELELISQEHREALLKKALLTLREVYDYIIIDCSPSLGLVTVNALTAADTVIIPVQPEFFALEGLGKLLQTIRLVQGGVNPSLTIEGFVVTMFDGRTKVHTQILQELRDHFKELVFKTIIQRNIRLSEAPSHGKPILLYDIMCNGSSNYLNLAREVLEHNGENI